jgi:hypothetical protein
MVGDVVNEVVEGSGKEVRLKALDEICAWAGTMFCRSAEHHT